MIKETTDRNKRVLFVDIDGILANCSHRLHYLENKDYDNFYKEVVNDVPYVRNRTALNAMAEGYNGKIVLLTGRPERTRKDTETWLTKYYDIPADTVIVMREDGDHRKAPEVKSELALKYVEDNDIKACMVLDDMEDNVQAVVDTISDKHPSIRVVGANVMAPKESDGEA